MTEAGCTPCTDVIPSPPMPTHPAAPKRTGRPPGPTGEARRHFGIRLSDEELAALDEVVAAEAEANPMAEVTRSTVVRELMRRGIEAWKRERESRRKRMSRQRSG